MSKEQFRTFLLAHPAGPDGGPDQRGPESLPPVGRQLHHPSGTIKDIPAGKACYAFEATDMVKAKEILGDTVCIRGNVPLSIMATGTQDQVRAYCKKLIDTVAKGGGYIMDTSTGLDDAKPENVKALFDFTREYGVY